MARNTPKFTIRSNDLQEYNRLMRNAKNKIRRLQKQGIDLMGEIELPNLKAFESRKQFNEWKEFTEKFNKGLKKDYKVETSPVTGIKMLRKEIKKYEMKEAQAIKVSEEQYKHFTSEQERMFAKPKKNLDIVEHVPWWKLQNRTRLDRRLEMLDRKQSPEQFTEREERFRDNFIKEVMGSFDKFWLTDEVEERLRRMNPRDLLQLMKNDKYNDIFTFEIYDSEGQVIMAHLDHLERMNEVLKEVERVGLENIDDDFLLKNFPDSF